MFASCVIELLAIGAGYSSVQRDNTPLREGQGNVLPHWAIQNERQLLTTCLLYWKPSQLELNIIFQGLFRRNK